jgi:putative membrane protein
MMQYFGNRMMSGRFIFAGVELLVCLAVMALVIVGIIALVRYIRVTGNMHKIEVPAANQALLILKERYAKGEITDEEYKSKKAEILK